MAERASISSRFLSSVGLVCLGAALLLMPLGVRAVRADDETKAPTARTGVEAPESRTAPEPTDSSPPPPASPPAMSSPPAGEAKASDATQEPESERTVVEDESGFIPLNTQGYNYQPEREAR